MKLCCFLFVAFLVMHSHSLHEYKQTPNTVLVHVILIIRDSSTASNEDKEWMSLQQEFFRNFSALNNVIINIHMTRIKLDYGNGYNPVGGTWYIMNKIEKFRKIYRHIPAYLVSNSINQEMALLATELKIPLIGCSQEYDIPSGLGIQQPIWMTLSPFDEYIVLKNVIIKRGHSGCVIFLTLSKFSKSVHTMLNNSFPEDFKLIINDEHDLHQFLANNELSGRREYIVIPYENISFINHAIYAIQKSRSNKAVILTPQNLFEEIIATPHNPLKKTLMEYDTYVSLIINIMNKNNDRRNCLNNSMSIIVNSLRQTEDIAKWCQKSLQNCLSKSYLFSPKFRMLKKYLRKFIEMEKLKINTMYFNVILKYSDVIRTKEFYDYLRIAQAIVINRDHVRVTSIHLKAITYLQSPHVMIRNITNDDGCNTKLYGSECYLLDNQTQTKQKYCCFGISIDIINEIQKLQIYTSEHRESLSGIKHATVEIIVMKPDSIHRNPIYPESVDEKQKPNEPLQFLANSEADLIVGSHIIINKLNLHAAVLTKPYFTSQLGLMIYRTDKLRGIMTFLYPFHWSMWVGIFITIQTVAIASTIYEWLSPYGQTPRGRNQKRIFSFSSGLTLCWSALFSHTVPTKSPKCWSSRFLMNVYACFCLIFLASYTAKLAAYMVGKNATRDISGIHDPKITSGMFKLGTIFDSGAHYHLQSAQQHLHRFLNYYNNSDECMEALKKGDIDIFIYDFEALQYFKRVHFREQFEVVGKPFGQLLYTIAINKHLDKTAKELGKFISKIISNEEFPRNMVQRIRLWTKQITGIDSSAQWSSVRLQIQNFSGPLIIFSFAIIIGFLSLLLEHLAFKYLLPWVRQRYSTPWCLPLSQRFHRHISCDPNYKKATFTERHLPKEYSQCIGERLINHRKYSGTIDFDNFLLDSILTYYRNVDNHVIENIQTDSSKQKSLNGKHSDLINLTNRTISVKDASSQTDEFIYDNKMHNTHMNTKQLQNMICILIHENAILSHRLSEILK